MAGVTKYTENGKVIIFADYRGCNTDEKMLEVLYEMADTVKEHNAAYYQLAEMTNVHYTPAYMKGVKELAKTLPQTAVKRAVVGVNSVSKRILLRGYSLLIKRG